MFCPRGIVIGRSEQGLWRSGRLTRGARPHPPFAQASGRREGLESPNFDGNSMGKPPAGGAEALSRTRCPISSATKARAGRNRNNRMRAHSFLSTLVAIWRLTIPYFMSEDRWPGRILLIAVIAAELGL